MNGIQAPRSKAKVWIHVDHFSLPLEVAVMKDLGDDAILGLDLGDVFDSIMLKHITGTRERKVEPVVTGIEEEKVNIRVTRSQSEKERAEAERTEVVQRNEGVKIKHPDEALKELEEVEIAEADIQTVCSEKGIDVPIVREVGSDKGKLRKEIAEDETTLLHLRGFADRGEKRYFLEGWTVVTYIRW